MKDILLRLLNVFFFTLCIVVVVVFSYASYSIYVDKYSYTLLTCHAPYKEGYGELKEKSFKVPEYVSDDVYNPKAEYWLKCLYKVNDNEKVIALLQSDGEKIFSIEKIDESLYAKYLIYNSFNLNIPEDKKSLVIDYLRYMGEYKNIKVSRNFSVENDKYDVWPAILSGLVGLFMGLILAFVLYRVSRYIIYGERLISKT